VPSEVLIKRLTIEGFEVFAERDDHSLSLRALGLNLRGGMSLKEENDEKV